MSYEALCQICVNSTQFLLYYELHYSKIFQILIKRAILDLQCSELSRGSLYFYKQAFNNLNCQNQSKLNDPLKVLRFRLNLRVLNFAL